MLSGTGVVSWRDTIPRFLCGHLISCLLKMEWVDTKVVRRNDDPISELDRDDRRPGDDGFLGMLIRTMMRVLLQVRGIIRAVDIISWLYYLRSSSVW